MAQNDFIKTFEKLIAEYTLSFIELSIPVAKEVLELINKGEEINDAVTTALNNNSFFGRHKDILSSILYKATCAGYGVNPDKVSHPAQVKNILLNEAWTPDKMKLSTRLHGTNKAMRNNIVNTIQSAFKKMQSLQQLGRDLYDGYTSGKRVINTAELPKYINDLQKCAKALIGNDRKALSQFNDKAQKAVTTIENLAGGGSPTIALKASYVSVQEAAEKLASGEVSDKQKKRIQKQLERQGKDPVADLNKAIDEINQAALDKAVNVAIQEKSRYIADRIARTELAAAYGDAFFAKNENDPDVIAYRWMLSDRHPKFDICDFNANANLYGLGKGIYPKDKFPHYPAHPHCMCPFSTVIEGTLDMDFDKENAMLDNAKFDEVAGQSYINSLSKIDQQNLLGVNGLNEFESGGSWRDYLRNWQGHSNPHRRFKANDFVEKSNETSIIDLKGDYSDSYKKKLLDVATKMSDNGLIPKEHSLNRIVGRIAQGRISDIESVISVALSGSKYRTGDGDLARYSNGIAVHFNDEGDIVTVVPRKKVPKTWEVIQDD
ncbi:MAG: hypothetical protein H6Q70_506 [Firmicutes bacterium]|nr:hypothetical protein [Bacillota bacterium]